MMLLDMVNLIRICRLATVCEAMRQQAHFHCWLNATFEIENRQRNTMTLCVSIVEIFWFTYMQVTMQLLHAEALSFKSLQAYFSLSMRMCHSRSAFLLYKISTDLPRLALTFFIQLHHQIYCTNLFIYCIYIIFHIICIYAMNIPCSI